MQVFFAKFLNITRLQGQNQAKNRPETPKTKAKTWKLHKKQQSKERITGLKCRQLFCFFPFRNRISNEKKQKFRIERRRETQRQYKDKRW
jgi:hypothetical protein